MKEDTHNYNHSYVRDCQRNLLPNNLELELRREVQFLLKRPCKL